MPQMIQRRGEGAGDALVELAVRECRQTGGEGGYGLVDLAGACGLLRFPLLALFVKLLAAVRGLLFHALLVERRSEAHTSELQSLMRISYAVFCLKKNTLSIH